MSRTSASNTIALLAPPTTLREKELQDSYQAGRQLAPLLLLLRVAKVRRRRAAMRKVADE